MFEPVIEFLNTLNTLSPVAVIGLLGTIIFMLVKGRTSADRKVEEVATNHLHGLPEMAETLNRIEAQLKTINDNIIYVKARVNGRD